MTDAPLDYARFGRQIALPEIGAAGQRRLASTGVAFRGEGAKLASALHRGAGGRIDASADIEIIAENGQGASMLGFAAFYAVEAARRALGEPARPIPEPMRDRLTLPSR